MSSSITPPPTRRQLQPTLRPEQRRSLFQRGIDLFNGGHFYDCHEAFEEIWRSTTPEPRDLFQGLIQVAVGLHHYRVRGNPGAAGRVMARGLARLAPLGDISHGLDLAGLRAAAERWRVFLVAPEGEAPELPRIDVVNGEAVR